ncbi:ABC transporter ATP-binding protein [Streptomyces qinzhouensis]|uniref:ABC transporter ATP-binding protein n=1 Tax=Streptomyces qinzhouensis TaxID=2599401 RepID=A0A5B8JLH0_9ACTN|nr:ABC transporter ATP-binding protein [Streptomyces qinzhouensis]
MSFPGPGDGSGGARAVAAVRGVDLTLAAGECLAVVGESGSGKTVTGRALLGLAGPAARVTADRHELSGRDVRELDERGWRALRGRHAGLVPQDALVSLDPLRRVGAEVTEALRTHRLADRRARPGRAVGLLEKVGVPEPATRARQYPHQLSGGLRQRALIAAALAAGPGLIVADEPTTALDATVQARILELLAERRDNGAGVLLISHDLAVVAGLADRIAVMHRGVVVEEGPARQVLRSPAHPYTRDLLHAVPGSGTRGTRLSSRAVRDPAAAPAVPGGGCGYADRCPLAVERCRTEEPPLVRRDDGGPLVRCPRTGEPWPEPVTVARYPAPVGTGRAEVLSAQALTASFAVPGGGRRQAVREVSLTLSAGETLGVVGESGSGKTTLARILMGLLEPDGGRVTFLGEPWSGVRERGRRTRRRRIQLVHQDPFGALDPRWTVRQLVGEAFDAPGGGRAGDAKERERRVREVLHLVGLDDAVLHRRPRDLSGGQRQRAAIARALAPEPAVLVCDEPVSALDVSVQAQVLDLFADIQASTEVAMVFISHDIGVIHHLSDRVLVMRDGAVVEEGTADDVLLRPRAAYTRELLDAVPRPERAWREPGGAGTGRPPVPAGGAEARP